MALVPFPNKSGKAEEADPDWDEGPEDDSAGKMSFLDHLDELRKRIIRSLIALVAGVALAFVFIDRIYAFVMAPMTVAVGGKLIFNEPTEGFMLYLKIGLIAGALAASPAIFTQVWLFIAPGLYSNEKKLAIPFVLLGSVLVVTGAAFAHYQAFPITLQFLASFSNDFVRAELRVAPTFNLYMTLVLMFSAIFQMPTLVLFLARMGLVTAKFLVAKMKYAILIIFIAGALLSPGGDPMGQILFAAPMFVLYCISIVLAWIFGKTRAVGADVS